MFVVYSNKKKKKQTQLSEDSKCALNKTNLGCVLLSTAPTYLVCAPLSSIIREAVKFVTPN